MLWSISFFSFFIVLFFFIFIYLTFSQNSTFHMFYRFNQWQLFQQLLDFPEYMVMWEWHLVFRGGHLPCDFSGITTHISLSSPLSKCSYFHLPFGKCICGYAPKNVGRNCRETDVKVLKGKAARLDGCSRYRLLVRQLASKEVPKLFFRVWELG